MKWSIDDNCRADLVFYSGIGMAGDETGVRVFPSGLQGELVHRFQSMRLSLTKGLRVYICTSTSDEEWMHHPWRCFRLTAAEEGVKGGARRRLLNIPDIDGLQDPTDKGLKHDMPGFPEVASPDDGTGWTFGRGAGELKNRIRMIRLVKE